MNFLKKHKLAILFIFLIPLLLTLFLGVMSIGVLGKYSIYTSDFKHQYQNFYLFYKNNLLSNPSLFLMNQNFGLGQETYGMFNYYLSSPLNPILLLFPDKNIELGITCLIYLKYILGSLCMLQFLKKYNLNQLLLFVVTLGYVFSGYALFNFINPIWLDILYFLPLSMLGIDYLIEKNNKKLFIIATSLMIISNFYIGYMLCILSFIYLVYSLLLSKIDNKELDIKKILINYFLSAGLIVLSTLTTLYTSYLSMSTSKGFSGDKFTHLLSQKINFFEFSSKLIYGSNGKGQLFFGFPNIWLPSLLILLCLLMLLSTNISKKLKLLNGSFILLIYLIFSTKVLNMIVHGFSEPIGFLFRDSFFFVFMVIVIVSDFIKRTNNLKNIKVYPFSYLIIASLISINTVIIFNYYSEHLMKALIILYLVINLSLILLLKYINKNKFMSSLIILLTITEIMVNGFVTIFQQYTQDVIANKSAFSEYYNEQQDISNAFENIDNNGYRVSKNIMFTEMEDINSNLDTVKGFTSNFKYQPLSYIKKLGLNAGDVSFNYNSRTLFTDFIFATRYSVHTNNPKFKQSLGAKTMMKMDKYSFFDRFEESTNQDVINHSNKIGQTTFTDVYENPETLQKMFLMSDLDAFPELVKDDDNQILQQNKLFKAFFNSKENILKKQQATLTTLKNATLTDKDSILLDNNLKTKRIVYTVNLDKDELVYIPNRLRIDGKFNSANVDTYFKSIYVNGVETPYSTGRFMEDAYLSTYLHKGENTIEFVLKNNIKKLSEVNKLRTMPFVYIMDTDILMKEITNYFNQTHMSFTSNQSNYMSVTIDKKGTNTVLGSTIPYDDFWKAYYNNQEIKTINNKGFLTVDIANIPENSQIDFYYQIPYFKTILVINILSFLFVLCYVDNKTYLKKKRVD